jgi:tripartite-type tricarboxylate transporter receptor subunit TctC
VRRINLVANCSERVEAKVHASLDQTYVLPIIHKDGGNDTKRTKTGNDMRNVLLLISIFASTFTATAHAEYPDRPIHLIVPQAAGSATDTVARIFGAALAPEIGQQIIIDDRSGGALTVGLDLTAKSAPDGYTLCVGPIGALAITRHLVPHLPYNIERDFQPIVTVTRGQLLLAVSPTTSFHSVKELIAYAKQNPGKLLNASSSNGSPGHVGGELFKFMTGTNILHVPYKGGAPAINDLIAGRVQVMFESLNSIAPFARSGAVRALAVTGDHRSPAFPDLPTVAEAGVPGYSAPTWAGAIAPAGVPRPIVDKLNAAMNRAIKSAAFRARFAQIGDEPAGGSPEEFAALIASDSKKWGEVIRRAGITFE